MEALTTLKIHPLQMLNGNKKMLWCIPINFFNNFNQFIKKYVRLQDTLKCHTNNTHIKKLIISSLDIIIKNLRGIHNQ
jgi:hypothetical protein